MQLDRSLGLLCAIAIGLCLAAAGAMTYVLVTDPTRDLQPQQEHKVLAR